MFQLFTRLSAYYRLRHIVNNVAIHIYAHEYRVASKLNLRPSNSQLMS